MIPAHWRIQADAGLRRSERGRVLIGGAPLGLVRLTERGAQIATHLFAGDPVGDDPARATLAGRLIDRAMAHPDPPPSSVRQDPSLCVIVPVRDDPEGLRRTIAALEELPGETRIVVVDDGSSPPLSSFHGRHEAPDSRIEVIRNPVSLGPAAARNVGLEHTRYASAADRDIVFFCDASVEIDADSIGRLLEHFDRERTIAVAPRITVRPSSVPSSVLDRYEQQHSPLDLGPLPSPVRPGAPVSYVPTACLLVRRSALREIGPFDPALRYGEDVDLIWRLVHHGDIRYEPRATATHPRRSSARALARQRFHYGSAAGPLGSRHGKAVTPMRTSPQTAATLGLVLAGHPVLASLAAAAGLNLLAPKLGDLEDRNVEAARFTMTGIMTSASALARAGTRAWWPLLAVLSLLPPTRGVARRWAAMSLAERAFTEQTLDPRYLALSMLDDVSYGAGLWFGAFRARTVAPVVPVLSAAREDR